MVSAHSDLDDAGELVTPTPRVKRILSSPRCLPHIAQVIFLLSMPITRLLLLIRYYRFGCVLFTSNKYLSLVFGDWY